jgi:chromosome partitioning protein
VKTVGFFSLKGGIGTTTLVYNLAWMYQELGIRTVALDLDPQADLTTAFLSDDRLADLHPNEKTVLGALKPLLRREGRIREPLLEEIAEYLALLPGDLDLSLYEDRFAEAWSQGFEDDQDALRVSTSFYQVACQAAQMRDAELVMIDVGPGVGAIHRAALVACDSVIIPLSPNLSSFQSLPALGLSLRKWRSAWKERLRDHGPSELAATPGAMEPLGYVVLQRAVIRDWHTRLAEELSKLYHHEILGEPKGTPIEDTDPHRLAVLKQYRSLMTLAQAIRKPIFLLKPADGAIGSQTEAVQDCYRDFKELALRIASACGIARSSEEE